MEQVIKQLFAKIELGTVSSVTKQTGGLINKLYRAETSTGTYAVKALNPKIMERPDAYSNHTFAERVAKVVLENGISAVPAIEFNGTSVQEFQGKFFLIYKWNEGKVIPRNEITLSNCEKVGKVLAQIHNVDFKELGNRKHETLSLSIDWGKYLALAKQQKAEWLDLYERNLGKLVEWEKIANAAHKKLTEYKVCHCDMDIKNILWVDNEPCVIDWESTQIYSPAIELVEYSFCWSLDRDYKMDTDKVKAFCRAYMANKKIDIGEIKIAVSANYSGKLNWLGYNIKRALGIESSDEQETKIANGYLRYAMDELFKYDEQKDKLMRSILEVTQIETA